MRKDLRGRPPKKETREKVKALRSAGYSYNEIADLMKLKSKQLARYYDIVEPGLDKRQKKGKIK